MTFTNILGILHHKQFHKHLVGGSILFFVGLCAGYVLFGNSQIPVSQKREDNPNLFFTNPLLSCGISENKEFSEYKPLEKSINAVISKLDPQKQNTVSVYYKDLNSGRWFGVNENEVYSPASLLKVPVMIAYLKEAETNPSILSKEIYYSGDNVSTLDEYYKSSNDIQPGRYYTVDELIASMIEHSDNAAAALLTKSIDNNSLTEIMTDIGFRTPPPNVTNGTDDYMTVKSYSYLFRLLYNSTYLSRAMSEKALQLLSKSDFAQGIAGGLPEGVQSARKFGERTVLDSSMNLIGRELHDCGIVYYTGHPYLLCVMTKGKDFSSLSSIIQAVSRTVYNSVQEEYK